MINLLKSSRFTSLKILFDVVVQVCAWTSASIFRHHLDAGQHLRIEGAVRQRVQVEKKSIAFELFDLKCWKAYYKTESKQK